MVSFTFLLCSTLLLSSAIAAPHPDAGEENSAAVAGATKVDLAKAAADGDHAAAEYVIARKKISMIFLNKIFFFCPVRKLQGEHQKLVLTCLSMLSMEKMWHHHFLIGNFFIYTS